MDRVLLKSTDIEALLRWRDDHKYLVRLAPAPLKAVEIVIEDTGYRIKGIRDGDRLRLACFAGYTKLIDIRAGYEVDGLMKASRKQLADGMTDENVQSVVTIYASLMALMTFGGEDRVEEPERLVREIAHKAKNKATRKQSPRTTYILRNVNGSIQMATRGSHASPSGIFTVRGHYRHYKSGKVVWIAEYKKGTGKKKPKTYKIKSNKGETK